MAGQPTKLTESTHALIVELVGRGHFRETAAAHAGIDPRTLRNWLKWGAEGKEPYQQFAHDLMVAEAEAEVADLDAIDRAGKGSIGDREAGFPPIEGDWKAIAWRRERMNPSRWAFRVKVEVQQELDAFLEALEVEFASEPSTLERIYRIAAAATSGAGAVAALAGAPGDGGIVEPQIGEPARLHAEGESEARAAGTPPPDR